MFFTEKNRQIESYINKRDKSIKVFGFVNNIVKEYTKDPESPLEYVEAGVLVLKKEVLELIEPDKKISLEEEIFPQLLKQKQLMAFVTDQRFYDIGTLERLEKIKEVLR